MRYILRERNSTIDIYKESIKTLSFLYNNFIGRFFLKIIKTRFIANTLRLYFNSGLSKCKINKFVVKNNIDISLYENRNFKSFNDFFIRKIISNKRPVVGNKDVLISPCDGKLSAYKITDKLTLHIKDSYYSIDTLIEKELMKDYINGYALVFRLDVDDYHRYCYIDSGKQEKNVHIKGTLHTVQPISLKEFNFYKKNNREYTILHTNNFDDVVHVEVGAMLIGRITNLHEDYEFKKGEEKGYFEYGGSTIVLLLKKDIIKIDKDILDNSNNSIETIVKYGESIGKKNT